MQLAEKTALVTGGAVRVGRTLSLSLAQAGMNVAVHYGTSSDAAHDLVDEIRSLGRKSAHYQADLRNPASVADELVSQVANDFGTIDVLVNNAAVYKLAPLQDTDDALWDVHLDVNLKAPVFLSRAFASHVGTERVAHIVNITDYRPRRSESGGIAYLLSKGGLTLATRLLARELAPSIRVNALALGAILPPEDAPDDAWESLRKRTPLQQLGAPEYVASALLFLLRSEFITGSILEVGGGEHLLGDN